jgi:hypothetical protein
MGEEINLYEVATNIMLHYYHNEQVEKSEINEAITNSLFRRGYLIKDVVTNKMKISSYGIKKIERYLRENGKSITDN